MEVGSKFGGVGICNIVVIWMCCLLLTLAAKILVVKYNAPESLKNVVLA